MLCHHSKTVFVHIPKNAGQSVERVFLDRLDLTWDTRAPLLLRRNDRSELGPPRLAHLTAQDYVALKYIPQAMFDDYYKFTFVRNPWDRAVSFYKYLVSSSEFDFNTFVSDVLAQHLWENMHWFVGPQSDYVFGEDGQMLVDFVGRFERLQDDFNKVCTHIGIPPTSLPYSNRSQGEAPPQIQIGTRWDRFRRRMQKPNVPPQYERYSDYYDDQSYRIVADLYRADIEAFDYTFG